MKANCWMGTRQVEVRDVPDPKIINPRDAIVRITSTAICGSDLHLYNGFIPTMKRGDIVGHEFMGEVVELGSAVTNLAVGDRRPDLVMRFGYGPDTPRSLRRPVDAVLLNA